VVRALPAHAGVVAVAIAAGAGASCSRERPLPAYPPATAAETAAAPAPADFAGATACAQCHAAQHDAWRTSTHGRAGGVPGETNPVLPFDGRPIAFADAVVRPLRRADGGLMFVVQRTGRADLAFPVAAIIGGAHLTGGGTQAYFTRHEDGTVRMLPWEQSEANGWFCNTATRAERGWRPITPDMRLADCGDWPPSRTLGQHERLANCQECHGSRITSVSADAAARVSWRSLTIDCEACHGPARAHVDAARAGNPALRAPLNPERLSKPASVQLCLRCHALKDAVQPGYAPGATLEAYYSIGLPALSGDALLPDGRTRTFAYQEGHLSSACFLNGGMTCVDCHTPHEQGYRSYQRTPLADRFDDGQCLGCHRSKATSVQQHTRHAPGSAGSRCVACHMAYIQQPAVGDALRYARADHTISIPRPALDSVLGVRGACASCHQDRSDTQLAADVARWYGELRPLPSAVAALIGPAETVPLAAVLDSATSQPRATLAVLGRELRRVAGARAASYDARTRAALLHAARSADVDRAAAAFALLHHAHGGEREVRAQLISVLTSHAARELVRTRAITLLGWLGDSLREEERTLDAIAAYDKALELHPASSDVQRNRGYALLQLGDAAAALAAFRSAAAQSSDDALAHIGAGLALVRAGQELAAADAYRTALRADPYEPLAHLNLGNVALRAQRYEEAARHYERALALDGSLADAHFNLARARIALGFYADAAIALRDGLDFEPGNASAAAMLAQLETVISR
jgi:tetratricopeptide (TPR) repeat protein